MEDGGLGDLDLDGSSHASPPCFLDFLLSRLVHMDYAS